MASKFLPLTIEWAERLIQEANGMINQMCQACRDGEIDEKIASYLEVHIAGVEKNAASLEEEARIFLWGLSKEKGQ